MGRIAVFGLWLLFLVLILLGDAEARVRDTVRLALIFALPAAVMMPWLPARWQFARTLWTLGWLAYFIHVLTAFHHVHGWSHAEAVAHVHRRSGFGQGIWFSHLFTLLGVFELVWWWLVPRTTRPTWANAAIYGYLGGMAFNATVVYETGVIRAGGLIMTVLIGWSLVLRRLRKSPCLLPCARPTTTMPTSPPGSRAGTSRSIPSDTSPEPPP